nr:MAG TPA: hypothetical protein [Caudoviricetes sp.]
MRAWSKNANTTKRWFSMVLPLGAKSWTRC